jgi:hypothetical protein
MEKSWIDSEDGRNAILEVSLIPECLQVITEAGNKQLSLMTSRVLEHKVSDQDKDRQFIVSKAELDGAREMLKCLRQLLSEAANPERKKQSGGRDK